MSATGLDVFDKTVQTTNIWLNEIMDEMGPDRRLAWHMLGAVLHALRDRLQPDLAVKLGAQLPILVRGAYYDGYKPSEVPDVIRTLDEFLDRVNAETGGNPPCRPRGRCSRGLQCRCPPRRRGTGEEDLEGAAGRHQEGRRAASVAGARRRQDGPRRCPPRRCFSARRPVTRRTRACPSRGQHMAKDREGRNLRRGAFRGRNGC